VRVLRLFFSLSRDNGFHCLTFFLSNLKKYRKLIGISFLISMSNKVFAISSDIEFLCSHWLLLKKDKALNDVTEAKKDALNKNLSKRKPNANHIRKYL